MVDQYLARYAEPIPAGWSLPQQDLPTCIVVPAYDEPYDFLAKLLGRLKHPAWVICVLNVPQGGDPKALQRTQALAAKLLAPQGNHIISILELSRQPLPKRLGVGLARKIGFDLALRAWRSGALSQPFVHSTDADAALPTNYLSVPYPKRGLLLYPFAHHSDDPTLSQRARRYEQHMNYYQSGLAYAGSPYAYTVLGSTFAVHIEDYAIARGIPKRNAGEDFHFASKVRKASSVRLLAAPQVQLTARLSERVPFGTGPALRAMQLEEEFTSYHPAIFEGLQQLTALLNQPPQQPTPDLPGWIKQAGEELGLFARHQEFWRIARDPAHAQRAVHTWFDALKTLRLVHAGQRVLSDQPLKDTLEHTPWLTLKTVSDVDFLPLGTSNPPFYGRFAQRTVSPTASQL